MMNGVYLIASGDGPPFKIGKSRDPHKRMATLQTSAPHKLTLVKFWETLCAAEAEREIHRRLDDCRLAGEWFSADASMIMETIEDVINAPTGIPQSVTKYNKKRSLVLLKAIGMGLHSPLYIWMWGHYAELNKIFAEHGPNWRCVAERCAAEGLRDGHGHPPSSATCRQTFWRVKRRRSRK